MAATKQVQVYNFETVQSRLLKDHLNKRSLEGEKVFAVYPSGLVSGSYDILTFHNKQVPVKAEAPAAAVATDVPKA
jgi:hypothetical protein